MEEAVKRMRILKMLDQPPKELEEDDMLNLSEGPGLLSEWEMDNDDLRSGQALAYVVSDTCRELGYIGVKPMHGGNEYGKCSL